MPVTARLAGFYFFYFAFVGAFTPYFGLYLKSLGFGSEKIGILLSIPLLMRIFAPGLWGWLADRRGRPAPLVRLAAAVSLALFAGVLAGDSFAWLALVLAGMSFFWSAALPLVESITLARVEGHSGAYARIRLWGSVGFIVCVLAVGQLLDLRPVALLPWVLLALLAGIAAFAWTVPDARREPAPLDAASALQVLAMPGTAALFLACTLMAAAHGPYYHFFSIHLTGHGYSEAAVGWLWALGVVCEIGVFLAMPRITRRVSLATVLGVSLAAAVLRFLALGWLVDSLPALVLAQALHALTFGAFHAAAVAAVHERFRGGNQARGQALFSSLCIGLGSALGGLMAGFAWDPLGAGWTYTLASACALGGLAALRRAGPAAGRAAASATGGGPVR